MKERGATERQGGTPVSAERARGERGRKNSVSHPMDIKYRIEISYQNDIDYKRELGRII